MNKLLEVALTQYGVKEIVGEQHNPVILGYLDDIGFEYINDDETPWCSTFINWCALKAGLKRTGKLNARSWLDIGKLIPNDQGQLGDVLIFKRGIYEWQGHVAIYIRETPSTIFVLGGNQGNRVSIREYQKADLLGIRRLQSIN
jgi:uncharacterized protein (TIGR02594 family)